MPACSEFISSQFDLLLSAVEISRVHQNRGEGDAECITQVGVADLPACSEFISSLFDLKLSGFDICRICFAQLSSENGESALQSRDQLR